MDQEARTGVTAEEGLVLPSDAPRSSGCACGGPTVRRLAEPKFVYAIGRIQARIPSLGVEKEIAQVTGDLKTEGLTDRETLAHVLTRREHRYLARRVCWVFAIEGVDSYVLRPYDDAALEQLVGALRAKPRPTDVDVIVGRLDGLCSPSACNGFVAPIVATEHVYSFDIDALVCALPAEPKERATDAKAVEEVFYRLAQMADNAGVEDRHRALNYLSVRYPGAYALAADMFRRSYALRAIDVRPSRLSTSRKLVDVVFTFAHRSSEALERHACRVDVTEEFPFLAAKLSPFYDTP